jgi:CRP-like cAMP-binding protein
VREVARLGPGQFFGEMSLMTGSARSATVVALADVDCIVVDRAAFQAILRTKESLATEIGQLLHEREQELKGDQEALSSEAAARIQDERQALLGRIKNFFGIGERAER